MLNPTPDSVLLDAQRRPYFLWDVDLTLEEFELRLTDGDPAVRAYWIAKLMRQAKPDDVFRFVSPRSIRDHWSLVEPTLGRVRAFWTWLFDTWEAQGRVWR